MIITAYFKTGTESLSGTEQKHLPVESALYRLVQAFSQQAEIIPSGHLALHSRESINPGFPNIF